MKGLATLLLGVSLLQAETSLEKGKRIVNEALAGLGGDRFLAMQDRVESGRAYSFYREELSGLTRATVYTRYLSQPKPGTLAVRERQTFGKKEESAVLFLADEGWEVSFRGARPLSEAALARYKISTQRNIFYLLRVRLREPGMTFDSRGADVFSNRPVEIVEIADAENRSVTVSFDQITKLPVRQVFFRRDPQTKQKDEEVTLYSKYRDVGGGVQWPFTILRERNGEKIFEIFSDEVKINKSLPDTLFTLPSGVKKLKGEK